MCRYRNASRKRLQHVRIESVKPAFAFAWEETIELSSRYQHGRMESSQLKRHQSQPKARSHWRETSQMLEETRREEEELEITVNEKKRRRRRG
jgi:hypothetical protein